ncbi:unnamed protein product [Triticum turgidum subsp. durum]|uniref:Uncharacterized protein n=1 Tax=Triticum turgidum subsp. durum TaxID=4567 RepID=A0A9R0Q311_TRITD|nr:unnamed protein product [Triticum turgidum subsp. durum]
MAEAEEWERRKRGRRRQRRGRRESDGSDPVEVLGEECAELMAGKAHIPRLTMIRTASKLSTYSMAIMDGKRNRITKEDLCDHAWEYRFTIAAPEYWRNLDPSWKRTGPPMRRYFHHDGYHSADPHDAVWGGHECEYTIITSFVGDGRIRDHYVRINRWPPMKVSRKEDWSWELSNHLYRYNSIPDAEKEGCTVHAIGSSMLKVEPQRPHRVPGHGAPDHPAAPPPRSALCSYQEPRGQSDVNGGAIDAQLHTRPHLLQVTSHDPEYFLVHFEFPAHHDKAVRLSALDEPHV